MDKLKYYEEPIMQVIPFDETEVSMLGLSAEDTDKEFSGNDGGGNNWWGE